jgi:hypothetical protein
MIRYYATGLAVLTLCLGTSQTHAAGNPARGQHIFGACAACHSLRPDQNMTGPSLADLWGRKAGSLPSFNRYSAIWLFVIAAFIPIAGAYVTLAGLCPMADMVRTLHSARP